MHRRPMTVLLAIAIAFNICPAAAQNYAGYRQAQAVLFDAHGRRVGSAAFVQTGNGLLMQLNVNSLPSGGHAIHIHRIGHCDPPDFQSAGGHLAPVGAAHGYLNLRGPHAGDLPNIYVPSDGTLRADFFLTALEIAGGPNDLLGGDGTALVIHANVDDYRTDPAGGAGSRIACGVIRTGTAPD